MQELNKHQPASPTFPVQDKLGQLNMATGLTKLEWMAATISAGWWHHAGLLPETIADEAIQVAIEILKRTEQALEDDLANQHLQQQHKPTIIKL
jgi:hypothetical protein